MYNNGSIKYLPTLVLESVVYEKIISWKQLMAGGIFTININGTAEPFNTLLSTSFNITVTFPMESIVKINVYDSVEQIELELIDPKTIIWEASNIGGIVCNDVIVTRIAFVPPFETDAPWDEFDLGSIEPGKTKQWSVNAFATDYGVGMVTYQAEYITGDTWEEKVSLSYTLNIFAVPSLNVLIDYTDSGVVDDTMNLSINMTNNSPISVNLWVSYIQDGHFFIQSTNDTSSISIESNETSVIYIVLLPKLLGDGKLTIAIGLVGVQNLELYDVVLNITITSKATDKISPFTYITLIIITLGIFSIIGYIIFRKINL